MSVYVVIHYTSGSSTIESTKDVLSAYTLIHGYMTSSIQGALGPIAFIEIEITTPNKKHTVWDIAWSSNPDPTKIDGSSS